MTHPVGSVRAVGAAAPAGQAGPAPARGAGFTLPTLPQARSGAPSALMPAALSSLLALQEAEPPEGPGAFGRRQAGRRLDLLRRLQLALLAGAEDPAVLRELADLGTEAGPVPDAGLAAVLAAIALRARVELARRRACA